MSHSPSTLSTLAPPPPPPLPPPPKKPRASDVRRRAVLPTTLQNLHAAANASTAAGAGPQLHADDFLDKVDEELNRKLDHDLDVLVEGMAELVKVHQIQGKDHFRVSQDAFQAEVRTESMIRAAHSLLSLSHTLKLLHLFADTATPAAAREARSATLDDEIARAKNAVRDLVRGQSGRGAP